MIVDITFIVFLTCSWKWNENNVFV